MSFPQKVTISLAHLSGITADQEVMSLYYDRGVEPVAADYDALATSLVAFFNSVATGAAYSLLSRMAPCIAVAGTPHTLRWYNVPAVRGPLGSPVASRTFGFTAATGANGLPAEVACCMSYQRTYGTDVEFNGSMRPRARDRGRIFLGPLSYEALTQDGTTKELYIASTMQTVVTKAAQKFLHDDPLANSWSWIHFSPTEWTWDAVTKVWCDNAFDTQRRRGVDPTTKTTVTL